jgi:hypothetical protein
MYFALESNGKGANMFLIDEPLLEYRTHGGSGTNRTSPRDWLYSISKTLGL